MQRPSKIPEKSIYQVNATSKLPVPISSKKYKEVEVFLSSDGCGIKHLEHVQITLDIEYNHRGALDIFLFSPAGTVSMILSRREMDSSAIGFRNWTFLSVHFWGENPEGKWKLLVRDLTGKNHEGLIKSAVLSLHGTHETPSHMRSGLKRYADPDIERAIDPTPEFEEEIPKDSSESYESSESNDIDLESLRFAAADENWPGWSPKRVIDPQPSSDMFWGTELDYLPYF